MIKLSIYIYYIYILIIARLKCGSHDLVTLENNFSDFFKI